jgi:diaminopimelate decarboxylase
MVAKIVAQTGATVTNVLSIFKKEEYHERVVVDIGVLRFPDASHPYVKVRTAYPLHFGSKVLT